MPSRFFPRYFMTTLVIVLALFTAFGQQGAVSLRGLITDEQGGAIVGATVTVLDTNGQTKTMVSNDLGTYLFNGLAPGKYTLSASAKGFAASDDTQIELKAGARQSM